MIKEIVQFVDALPPETFSRNLQLKEGLYMFLDVQEENGKAVLKNVDKNGALLKEDILSYKPNDEEDTRFELFFFRWFNSINISEKKHLNPIKKIFGLSSNPYSISFRRKNFYKKTREQISGAIEEMKNSTVKYVDQKYLKKHELFYIYLKYDFYDFVMNHCGLEKNKDVYEYHFYMKSIPSEEYEIAYTKYQKDKVFNKNEYNYPKLKKDSYPKDQDLGIVDAMSGFQDKKRFLIHKTSFNQFNLKISNEDARAVWRFCFMANKKQIPNPCPVFIDKDELNKNLISFFQNEKLLSHTALLKRLIESHNDDLPNYYLLYFQRRIGGSRIVDIDFVPRFEYEVENLKLYEIFPLGERFKTKKIKNVFQLQEIVFNEIFNHQLVTANGWLNYFEDIEPNPKYHFTDAICNSMLQYRKSIYDYIYKSRRQSISCEMFDTLMKTSILEDIRIDEYKNEKHSRSYAIKEKLNLWFSLYKYFNQNQNRENMASKIPELLEKMKQVANGENISFSENPAEFAFGAGQLVYFLLTKSAASNKSYAMLEPFLQKTTVTQLQNAISNSIAMYKHEIDISKGRFERLASEVLAYESDINMKDYLRYFLAGCFAQSIIYEKKKTESTN